MSTNSYQFLPICFAKVFQIVISSKYWVGLLNMIELKRMVVE